jgi:hypothetical protein
MGEPVVPPAEPAAKNGGLGCLGCLGIIGLVVVLVVGLAVGGVALGRAMNPPDACDEAYEAKVLSERLDNPDDRTIAAMQYAVKAAECAQIGGTIRGE